MKTEYPPFITTAHKAVSLERDLLLFLCHLWHFKKSVVVRGERKNYRKAPAHLAKPQTKSVRDGLKTIKSPKKQAEYREQHESDFIIAESAARYFKAHGIEKLPKYKTLQAEIEQLTARKNAATTTTGRRKIAIGICKPSGGTSRT